MPKYPFKPANLVHHDYDLKKRWYVECHVWSLADNGMVRRRYYGGINRYHTVVMRMKAGIGLEKEVNQMLKDGYIVKVEDPRPKTDDIAAMTIGEAFDFVIVRKENTVRPLSLTVYKSNVNQFKLWLVKKNMAKLRINQLTKSIVLDYMDSLFDAGRVSSNASYNNVFTVFRMIVNYLIDRDHKLFPIHPVKGVKQLKATAKKHAAFSKDEMSAIKLRMIEEGELQLLTFVQFMCYALIRPNELRNLKVGNIEIEKRRILIPRAVAKNGKSEYVDIYNPLLEVINESGIMSFPESHYIFSTHGTPGPTRLGHEFMAVHFNKILRLMKMKSSDREFSLYSWKHTGAIYLYMSGLDLIDIQKQCRHSTINQTMEYLRELELFRKTDHFNKVKSF